MVCALSAPRRAVTFGLVVGFGQLDLVSHLCAFSVMSPSNPGTPQNPEGSERRSRKSRGPGVGEDEKLDPDMEAFEKKRCQGSWEGAAWVQRQWQGSNLFLKSPRRGLLDQAQAQTPYTRPFLGHSRKVWY